MQEKLGNKKIHLGDLGNEGCFIIKFRCLKFSKKPPEEFKEFLPTQELRKWSNQKDKGIFYSGLELEI